MLASIACKSRYVAIGSLRALKAFCFSEILVDTSLFIFIFHSRTFSSSCFNRVCFYIFTFFFVGLVVVTLFLSSGRAPFDLAESESELIAGYLTEVGGVAFSFMLLVDYCEIIFLVSVFNLILVSLLALC